LTRPLVPCRVRGLGSSSVFGPTNSVHHRIERHVPVAIGPGHQYFGRPSHIGRVFADVSMRGTPGLWPCSNQLRSG
jgi:hypothetical protein